MTQKLMKKADFHATRASRRAGLLIASAMVLTVFVPRFVSGPIATAAILAGGALMLAAIVAYAGVLKAAQKDYDERRETGTQNAGRHARADERDRSDE